MKLDKKINEEIIVFYNCIALSHYQPLHMLEQDSTYLFYPVLDNDVLFNNRYEEFVMTKRVIMNACRKRARSNI